MKAEALVPFGEPQVGAMTAPFALQPGESKPFVFVVAWHFLHLQLTRQGHGRWYASQYKDASAVLDGLAKDGLKIVALTDLWSKTWYDSSLPWWVLDRTLDNVSTLAANTCFRFLDGRFYGFEGVYSYPGCCSHVWHYSEGHARLFPELEQSLFTQAVFVPGLGIQADGSIPFRMEGDKRSSIDGQCGYVLRAYRTHLLSPDDRFVKAHWPQIRRMTEYLFAEDTDGDNLPDRLNQQTLDEDIIGPSAWISSLWLAAVKAAGKMAAIAGDEAFAADCVGRVAQGEKNFMAKLWNGDRFIHVSPEAEKWRPAPYDGSHIDQLLGQQWAWRTDLGRILPEKETRTALASVFRNNFFVDVGSHYRKPGNRPSRVFAEGGDAGTVVGAWPEGTYRSNGKWPGYEKKWSQFHQGFYNETMSGFEHQFASHLVYEGMVPEGLAVMRAVHDRHVRKGRLFNEPEAGSHYARAMASYAVFMALSGFEYDGPGGHIGFAPRLTPENFKAAFTAAEGWGCFSQKVNAGVQAASVDVVWGKLKVKTISLESRIPAPIEVTAEVNGRPAALTCHARDGRIDVTFGQEITISAGDGMKLNIRTGASVNL